MGIDLRFEPEPDELFRAIPEIKDLLDINIELAAPSDFIPELPGWQDRCPYIGREGTVSFYHYGPYSQALSKIERGHEQDIKDIASMLKDGMLDKQKLLTLFNEIAPQLHRYPAISPEKFAAAVNLAVKSNDN